MIFMHRPLSMAGVGSRTQSPAFTGLFAYLKTFGFPQAMNPLVVHTPAFLTKQNSYPAITISGPFQRQSVHIICQLLFFLTSLFGITLCRTCLTESIANPSFGISQPITENLDRLSATGRSYKFFADTSMASFIISMSIRWSAMIFRRRWFSF